MRASCKTAFLLVLERTIFKRLVLIPVVRLKLKFTGQQKVKAMNFKRRAKRWKNGDMYASGVTGKTTL